MENTDEQLEEEIPPCLLLLLGPKVTEQGPAVHRLYTAGHVAVTSEVGNASEDRVSSWKQAANHAKPELIGNHH